MSWKKHFSPVNITNSPVSGNNTPGAKSPGRTNFNSFLPDMYTGHPNRLERYSQYGMMDMDSEVNAGLDILAEFCSQTNDVNGTPFDIDFKEQATQTEVKLLKKYLQQWCKLNRFHTRIFKIVRNTFKYGDSFFIRDPETLAWLYIDPSKVDRIIVNESEGKVPEQYIIRDLNVNLQNLSVSQISPNNTNLTPGGVSYATGAVMQRGMVGAYPTSTGSRFNLNQNQAAIDAKHVIQLSVSEGLDENFPFGNSLMESIFKVYKQKELLEDAIIIYRIQRAPERRVFYLDTGNLPPHLAMAFTNRVKDEINQRRIPSTSGGGCFSMDTEVPLLDGRCLSLRELSDEYQAGKVNWAYSCNPTTGGFAPGIITWAGVTHKKAKVMKLTLDNGETITCTPCHKFPILGKGFVEAKDLIINESFIPLNTRDHEIAKGKNSLYTQIYQNDLKEWQFVHRLVAKSLKNTDQKIEMIHDQKYANRPRTVIHHKDFNRYNNSPENLAWMNYMDHIRYHFDHASFTAKKRFSEMTPEQWARWRENNRKGIKSYFDNRTEKQKERDREVRIKNGKLGTAASVEARKIVEADPVLKAADHAKRTAGWDRLRGTEKYKKRSESISNSNKDRHNTPGYTESIFEQERLVFNKKILDTVQSMCIGKTTHELTMDDIVANLNLNDELRDTFVNDNGTGKKPNFDPSAGFKSHHLTTMVKQFGYTNWMKFRKEAQYYNHKLVAIEYLDEEIEVGTLTIDGDEKYHNFHTFAIKQGVYTKNSALIDASYNPLSIGDDYFFPQSADGRGSKVEILPGGQNLGSIDDLRYFTNKMFRALRIPSSYLPTGPDDGGSSFNDGRVGTAYIQELRFNKYCERLQSLLNDQFNNEFKMYILKKGLNIDPSLFDLKFNPPQNFAAYRQAEMDSARIGTFGSIAELPYLSKRFALKRFLGLTQEEITENEMLFKEENLDNLNNQVSASNEMRSAGITGGGITSDMSSINNAGLPPEGMEGMDSEGMGDNNGMGAPGQDGSMGGAQSSPNGGNFT